MPDYKHLIPHLHRLEGGFVNHPADSGKATNRGITMATWKKYCKQKMKVATVDTLRDMSEEEWTEIYKTMYWDKCQADHLNDQSIADFLVDWYWHSGSVAIRHAQRLAGEKADGIMGPRTLTAINAQPALSFFWSLHRDRTAFLTHRAETKPSQKVFLKGWLNRVNSFTYGGFKDPDE